MKDISYITETMLGPENTMRNKTATDLLFLYILSDNVTIEDRSSEGREQATSNR